jgi:hypothetical protein
VGNYSNFSVFADLILSSFRRVHFQGLMDADAVVIIKILLQDPPDVCFAKDGDLCLLVLPAEEVIDLFALFSNVSRPLRLTQPVAEDRLNVCAAVLHYATAILSCNSFSMSDQEIVGRSAKPKSGSVRAHEVPFWRGEFRQVST